MPKVTRKIEETRTLDVASFHFLAEKTRAVIRVSHKSGVIPFYSHLFSVEAKSLSELIEVLTTLRTEIEDDNP